MPRIAKRISPEEMLRILNNQWLTSKDIKLLACVGMSRATEIRHEISEQLLKENYFLPAGVVPCEKVIEYLNINIKYLRKIINNQDNNREIKKDLRIEQNA